MINIWPALKSGRVWVGWARLGSGFRSRRIAVGTRSPGGHLQATP